jgi:hypothetical protein
LYRGVINLWVEDELTRSYLSAVWNDPTVAFLVGGGNEGVRAVVHDAEESRFPNVFGLIDRDFRRSNKAGWFDPNKTFRTFVLPVHEIENYLLDPNALAAAPLNNLGKKPTEIEDFMQSRATRLCWWAACRDVIAELRVRFREGFVGDPSCELTGKSEAHDHICDSAWFRRLASECGRTTPDEIGQLIDDAYQKADRSLADGSWKNEFAGKEILRDVGSRICDQTKLRSRSPSQAVFDEDLAKQVGEWQRLNGAVRIDLTELRQALHQRIERQKTAEGH